MPLTLNSIDISAGTWASYSTILAQVCVPLLGARPGDIIGVVASLTFSRDGVIHLDPIDDFLVRDETGFRTMNWSMLPEDDPRSTHLALTFTRLHSRGHITGTFMKAIAEISSRDENEELMSLILTPSGGILSISDYQEDILESRSWDNSEISQQDIDDCHRLILPEAATAHERLARTPSADALFDLCQSLHPIRWGDSDPVTLKLSAGSSLLIP